MRGRTRPRTNDEWIAKKTLADEIPGDSNRLPAADDVVLRPDTQGRHQAENEQKGCYPASASRVRRRSILPALEAGQKLTLKELKPEQHFTEPPPRFNEASLVKELEERGIGRPSTYAAILTTIQERQYVQKLGGKFSPTEIGLVVTDLLVENFRDIFDVEYTAHLEEELDEIEEGKETWTD